MLNISNFFDKFKNRAIVELNRRAVVIAVIKKVTGVDIPEKSLKIEQGKVILSISSIEKNEIFMKKKVILDTIAHELPSFSIREIV